MTDHEPAADETAALRARISALSAASLRISASLDLEMVLNEVVESARALTGARYGAIATIDEAGAPQDFVTSGFTADEHRHIMEWPDGPRLFEFFRDLPGPLRIPDVPAYVRALGFSPDDRLPSKTFQGTPMRHRGVHVGNFYLVEKAGGEAFTDEDEEILVLFAAQAATAIANARTYRAERRARADLEALIETSPVGVVVFEARTGALVSLNREAARIVQDLCGPGQSAEQLLGVITCRRADGARSRSTGCRWRGRWTAPRRCGPRRSCSRSRTGAVSRRSSTPPRSATRTARTTRSPRSWSPCRTWRRCRKSSACGPSSWAW